MWFSKARRIITSKEIALDESSILVSPSLNIVVTINVISTHGT